MLNVALRQPDMICLARGAGAGPCLASLQWKLGTQMEDRKEKMRPDSGELVGDEECWAHRLLADWQIECEMAVVIWECQKDSNEEFPGYLWRLMGSPRAAMTRPAIVISQSPVFDVRGWRRMSLGRWMLYT